MGDAVTAGFSPQREQFGKTEMEILITENTEVTLLKGELKGNKIPVLHVSKQSGVCPSPAGQLAAYNQHKKHDKRRNWVSQSPAFAITNRLGNPIYKLYDLHLQTT